jgi:hypothetical protein
MEILSGPNTYKLFSLSLPACLPACLPSCLPPYLSVCLLVCLSVCVFIYLSVYLSENILIKLSSSISIDNIQYIKTLGQNS